MTNSDKHSNLFVHAQLQNSVDIGITHVFSCINICWVLRKLFEHEAVNAMKQTCVIVILAYFP